MSKLPILAAFLAALLPSFALAQSPASPPAKEEPRQLDPRLVEPTIRALRGEIAALQGRLGLSQAETQALFQDAQKREREWSDYARPLWQMPEPTPPPPPAN